MSQRRPRFAPGLVLVVDDMEDNRDLYAEYLRGAGYDVACAGSGEEAVALARELAPVAIVMDLAMPSMDGAEATRILKADPKTSRSWIIVVSAHSDREHVRLAMSAGADDFATKPLAPSDLGARIAAALVGRAASSG
jgi:CheY-like chemotaxis protein